MAIKLTAEMRSRLGLGKAKQRLDRVAKEYPQSLFDMWATERGHIIWLPWPPSNNVYWRRYRNVTTISPDGKAFRKAVETYLAGKGIAFGESRLGVSIRLLATSKRRYDLDNFAKVILDSLVHASVFADDSQIDLLMLERGVVSKGAGMAIVSIWKI